MTSIFDIGDQKPPPDRRGFVPGARGEPVQPVKADPEPSLADTTCVVQQCEESIQIRSPNMQAWNHLVQSRPEKPRALLIFVGLFDI